MGSETSQDVIKALRENAQRKKSDRCSKRRAYRDSRYPYEQKTAKPHVISVVGVNGTGKTTTIGKIVAALFSTGKERWYLRPATLSGPRRSNLRIWSDRSGVDFISQGQGADSAAVGFDAL